MPAEAFETPGRYAAVRRRTATTAGSRSAAATTPPTGTQVVRAHRGLRGRPRGVGGRRPSSLSSDGRRRSPGVERGRPVRPGHADAPTRADPDPDRRRRRPAQGGRLPAAATRCVFYLTDQRTAEESSAWCAGRAALDRARRVPAAQRRLRRQRTRRRPDDYRQDGTSLRAAWLANTRDQSWETCDHTLGRFCPDGEHVLGRPAYLDGPGRRPWSVLDADRRRAGPSSARPARASWRVDQVEWDGRRHAARHGHRRQGRRRPLLRLEMDGHASSWTARRRRVRQIDLLDRPGIPARAR